MYLQYKVLSSNTAKCWNLWAPSAWRFDRKPTWKAFRESFFRGGESTVQGKLLHKLDMFEGIQTRIREGLPVLATCAGMILLAQTLYNDPVTHLATLPVTVRRNAYGRQLGSFITDQPVKGIGEFPMVFIRAPYIESVDDPDVEVLSTVDDHIVAVRYGNQLGLSFHPEMTEDTRIHEYFLKMIQ